ncbi:MAG: hypothetical protein GXO40_02160 [Epsilonproteobacteria bacterium]|nr:hypothetical protein [Campylobacterota bacterium]
MANIRALQFTPIYEPREDRIRLIINLNHPTRYDMFITRKFLLDLISHIKKLITPIPLPQSESTTQSDTPQPIYSFEHDAKLLETINISFDKDKGAFNITLSDGIADIQTVLQPHELNNLIMYMVKCIKPHWGSEFENI